MRTPVSRIERIGGLFIIVALGVLAATLVLQGVLSGRFFAPYDLRIAAEDGIGLRVGDWVMMRGIQIGKVSDLRLDPNDRVLIDCKIFPSFQSKLTTGTTARLVPPDLFGYATIRLLPAPGSPLEAGALLYAERELSLTDRIGTVSKDFGRVFEKVERAIEQVGDLLASAQRILDGVERGEGLAGSLVRGNDLPDRVRAILGRTDETLAGIAAIRSRLEEFSTVLPTLREDLVRSSGSMRSTLERADRAVAGIEETVPEIRADLVASVRSARAALQSLEEGMERFPRIATDAAFAIEDSRRVLESLQRSFLIRGNLPRSTGGDSMLSPFQPFPLPDRESGPEEPEAEAP